MLNHAYRQAIEKELNTNVVWFLIILVLDLAINVSLCKNTSYILYGGCISSNKFFLLSLHLC